MLSFFNPVDIIHTLLSFMIEQYFSVLSLALLCNVFVIANISYARMLHEVHCLLIETDGIKI